MPRTRKQQTAFEKNLEVVQSLTDRELREELAYYSVSAAITGTTRGLYEKKLATLLAGGKPTPKPESEEEEEEEQEDFSDTEPEEDHRISDRGDARKFQTPSATTRHRAGAEKVSQEQQTSPRKEESESEERRGVSLWVQLFIFLVVAAAIFAIWYFWVANEESKTRGIAQNV